MSLNLLLVAGEASADLHGSSFLRALQKLEPDVSCFGVGGKELASAGMEIVVPADKLNVVGIADWVGKWREVLGAYRTVREAALDRRPDCAVLLDLPDFNLKLSRQLHAHGIPVIYYISPQVWAWRQYRVRTIRKCVDRMLVVFPFEQSFYRRKQVDVEFVGHPLLERIRARTAFRSQYDIERTPRVALLPGSRASELRHHGPILRKTVEELLARFPSASFRVPVASTLEPKEVRALMSHPAIEIVEGRSWETIVWADLALVASGTATLETALLGTPFCLYYRVNGSSAWVIKNVLRYKSFFGMPNLLHRREVVKEFFQERATPRALFEEAAKLILDETYRKSVASTLSDCWELLGNPGASDRVAREVQRTVRKRRAAFC